MRLINSYGGTVPYGTSSNSYYSNYGGYYNNYNPYYYMQQKEEQERQRQQILEEQKRERDIFDILNRTASRNLGKEISFYQPTIEEVQNDWYTRQTYISEVYQYNQLADNVRQRRDIKNYTSYRKEELDNHISKVYEEMAIVREPKTLYEFLENSGSIRMQLDDQERKNNDLSKAYNGADYRQLLNLHNQTYDSLSQRYTIDDMEISLPDRFKGSASYREAKAKFLNAILPM